MTKSMTFSVVSAVAAAAVLAYSAMPVSAGKDEGLILEPLKGVSLDIGTKHAVGYFLSENGACNLTVVLATSTDGEVSEDSPGTRVQVSVQPGAAAIFDAANGKTGEFFCGPAGSKMNARVVDRTAWTAAKS